MKTFKFEIVLTEQDLSGDEFWEEAVSKDGTGIGDLTKLLEEIIIDSNLIVGSDKPVKDIIRLVSYTDKTK